MEAGYSPGALGCRNQTGPQKHGSVCVFITLASPLAAGASGAEGQPCAAVTALSGSDDVLPRRSWRWSAGAGGCLPLCLGAAAAAPQKHRAGESSAWPWGLSS